jgi:hypothetical protein
MWTDARRPPAIAAIAILLAAAAACLGTAGAPLAAADFRRGDPNTDGGIDTSDAVRILFAVFALLDGEALPVECEDAADSNDDGLLDLADAVHVLNFAFLQGAAPRSPFPDCGADATDGDALGCAAYAGCEGPADDLAPLSDAFDGEALDPSWTLFQPHLIDIAVAAGALSLRANQHSLWYQGSRGPFLHKLVTGDFRVSATVRARRASDPSLPPLLNIHLGGLMARNPASDGAAPENYVFIVTGNDVNDLSVETKTTRDGESIFQGPSWGSGDAELSLCRRGSIFSMYKRRPGEGAWELAATYAREDLPAALQVGPVVYAAAASPDLSVSFAEVVFERLPDGAPCEPAASP